MFGVSLLLLIGSLALSLLELRMSTDALNILLTNALGGGGIASLRIDPQGKAHGQQLLDPARRMIPSSYFCKQSGAGRASLARTEGVPRKVGIIGLGCGALLGYGRKEDDYRLYEINPQVFEIAKKNFTFMTETPAKVTEVLGDGRLSLEAEPPQNFDLLFMDAFSGDSIPVHLVTREAFDLYARHLKPDAILSSTSPTTSSSRRAPLIPPYTPSPSGLRSAPPMMSTAPISPAT